MAADPLLVSTPAGLYCPAGEFYIDPWRRVDRAIITHAHSDHARPGMGRYLAAREGAEVLRVRLGNKAVIDAIDYGEPISINGVRVSLHPAGHILGSSQIRVEHRGEVWVVSGDYKVAPDWTCRAFEPVRCHTFITESTFGMPIYRWPDPQAVTREINDWWRANAAEGVASLLMAYSLGKAQRLLGSLDPSIGPIFTHDAVEPLSDCYRRAGINLPATQRPEDWAERGGFGTAMVIAPPSVVGSPWFQQFGAVATAFASGWMMVRGTRRRRNIARGFVVSDHADWPELIATIRATEAERVLVTHGSVAVLVRWLREHGWDAGPLVAERRGEDGRGEEEGGEEGDGDI
ncbi:MAG: ligase-associated DNA damage response exonuclease [Planctomycetaceae bacterium]|nr:ligase-associated DNA damage response exonuclease [Planctomycetaceae bacterium]